LRDAAGAAGAAPARRGRCVRRAHGRKPRAACGPCGSGRRGAHRKGPVRPPGGVPRSCNVPGARRSGPTHAVPVYRACTRDAGAGVLTRAPRRDATRQVCRHIQDDGGRLHRERHHRVGSSIRPALLATRKVSGGLPASRIEGGCLVGPAVTALRLPWGRVGYMTGAPFYRVDRINASVAWVVQFGYSGVPSVDQCWDAKLTRNDTWCQIPSLLCVLFLLPLRVLRIQVWYAW